ncbi:hypothetical protein ANN_22723 [Periplaneta americana]|uniref:Uncharacterized protein n=1 Tax=Periplaneta americana TaxID=6978 RepID=A0ABQ8SL26_PERAM|nr:hypothetical protein ANN_22723 [Periplaneta americana]
MAGLCEGGNEPPGSLKANKCRRVYLATAARDNECSAVVRTRSQAVVKARLRQARIDLCDTHADRRRHSLRDERVLPLSMAGMPLTLIR